MINIDGGFGESGGQIIRTAIGLSAVTGKPCSIFNIRKDRPKPGLQAQHLKGIEAVAGLCNAKVKGLALNSTEVEFHPGNLSCRPMKIDVGTAGAVTLVLQSLFIPAVHADREFRLEIIGGTHVKWSPSVDYFEHVFCRFMEMMGIETSVEVIRHGFYPAGGGKVGITIKPGKLRSVNLTERGKYVRTDIFSIASMDLEKSHVAERQVNGAEGQIKTIHNVTRYAESLSTGSSVHMHSHYDNTILGAGFLGERGMPAEKVGEECAKLLKSQMDSGACLDMWMADQILPYMALSGKSEISVAEVTGHARTNMWAIEKFLPVKFSVNEKKPAKISCNSA